MNLESVKLNYFDQISEKFLDALQQFAERTDAGMISTQGFIIQWHTYPAAGSVWVEYSIDRHQSGRG